MRCRFGFSGAGVRGEVDAVGPTDGGAAETEEEEKEEGGEEGACGGTVLLVAAVEETGLLGVAAAFAGDGGGSCAALRLLASRAGSARALGACRPGEPSGASDCVRLVEAAERSEGAAQGRGAVEGIIEEEEEEVSTARLRLPGERTRDGLSGLDVLSPPSSRVCRLRCASSA